MSTLAMSLMRSDQPDVCPATSTSADSRAPERLEFVIASPSAHQERRGKDFRPGKIYRQETQNPAEQHKPHRGVGLLRVSRLISERRQPSPSQSQRSVPWSRPLREKSSLRE